MKLNAYCNECLTRTKQHCAGRDGAATDDAATDDVQVMRADGSYEVMADYVQANITGCNKPHGLKFCSNYQLDPAQLPRPKSAQTVRDEFNAQRAANKAVTKAKKDTAKAEKLAEKKLKAKQKIAGRKQKAQARRDTEQAAKRETPVVAQVPDDDFSDLII